MPEHRFSRRYIIFNVLSVLIFVVLAVFTHVTLKNKETLYIDNALEQRLSQFSLSATEQLQSQVGKLRSISSFVSLTRQLSPQDFDAYGREFTNDNDGWLVIEWQPIVREDNRQEFESVVAQQYFDDFRLWEPDEDGLPVPAKPREEHVPVLFMLASTDATNTTGLDLAWSEERMQSKWLARDSGNAQLSGLFDVVLSAEVKTPPFGFAITVPVYRTGIVPETRLLRRQQIIGYVAGVYSLEQTLNRELENLREQGLAVQIADAESNSITFSPSNAPTLPSFDFDDAQQVTGNVVLLGQQWKISLKPTETFSYPSRTQNSRTYPLLIMFFWVFITAGTWWVYRKNKQLVQVKAELEKTLEHVKLSEKHYEQLSRHDSLTGLLNRRAFIERLEQEMSRSDRYGQNLCLLVADIDEFKKVNDTFGHVTGDLVLQQFAKTCRKCCREQDLVCRFGGEEFAVLMINTDIEEGLSIAARLLKEISSREITDTDTQDLIRVTFSGGITTYQTGDDVTSLLARADNALYQSKHQGRNQLTSA